MRTVFIDPGALRSELTLERAAYADDGAGGQVETWSEVGTVFGRIEPLEARSVFGAGQTIETTTHRVTLRFRSGLTSGMRMRRGDRVFEIVTVADPDETGRYLTCRVREKGL